MKNILLVVLGLIIGAAGMLYAGEKVDFFKNDSIHCYANLTVRRADAPDIFHVPHATTTDLDILSFIVTNHTTSTTYNIRTQEFYYGLGATHPVDQVTNVSLRHDGTTLSSLPKLFLPYHASTSPFMLPPGSSAAFVLRGTVYSTSTPTATTSVRLALGRIIAENEQGVIEPVYKEENLHELHPPTEGIDDSIESTLFIFE